MTPAAVQQAKISLDHQLSQGIAPIDVAFGRDLRDDTAPAGFDAELDLFGDLNAALSAPR